MGYTIEDEALLARLQAKADEYGISLERWLGLSLDLLEMSRQRSEERDIAAVRLARRTPWSNEDLFRWEHLSGDVQDALRRLYDIARRYWQEKGDLVKGALSDEELYEQLEVFEEGNIPRLRSEVIEARDPATREVAARHTPLHLSRQLRGTGEDSDTILNAEYGEYLLRRQRGEHVE